MFWRVIGAILTVLLMVAATVRTIRAMNRVNKAITNPEEPNVIERLASLDDPRSLIALRVRAWDERHKFLRAMLTWVGERYGA